MLRILAVLVVGATGCDVSLPKPQPRPIEEALGTAMPIGYAASVAIPVLSGETNACVALATPCPSPPCSGALTIDVDRCPLPLLASAAGTIAVTAAWTGTDTIVFGAVFGDVSSDGRRLIVESVDVFTATRNVDDNWTIAYVDQDVAVRSDREVRIEQSGWVLELDQGDDLADPFDDAVIATGAMQAAEGTRVTQTVLTGVRMDAGCLLNPLEGQGLYETIDAGQLEDSEITTMYFEPPCDGRARVVVTIGAGIGSSGKRIELDLLARD